MRRAFILALLLAAPALAKAPAHSIPASALLIRQSSPAIDWRWRAAPEAATQPGLINALRAEALHQAARETTAAARDAVMARKAGIPFRRYETVVDWSLAADTPRLLALAGEFFSFTGGAHGNSGYSVKIWDKATRRSLTTDALFSDWPRARKLLEPVFCKALAKEQAQRHPGQLPGGDFDKCPGLSDQPIVPWGGLTTRAPQFRALVGPYVAGPYSDGSYIITMAWPESVRTLVKPAYRTDLFGDQR